MLLAIFFDDSAVNLLFVSFLADVLGNKGSSRVDHFLRKSFLAEDLFTIPVDDKDFVVPLNLVWKKQNAKKSLQTFVQDFKLYYRNR